MFSLRRAFSGWGAGDGVRAVNHIEHNRATARPRGRAPGYPFAAMTGAIAISALALTGSAAESLFDESTRAQMLRHGDGPVAHIETEYNDLFIAKSGSFLLMSTRYRAESNIHSIVNLM